MEAETVEPAFVVFEGGIDVGPGKFFGVVGVGTFETCLDEGALGFGEKGGGGRVVVDEEVCQESNDYGEKTFL